MQVRRPARVALPDSAYADMAGLSVPESLADLEVLPGRCFSTESVTQCPQAAGNVVCGECAMVELGESWTNFKSRTNSATPKAKFYRDLDAAQAGPDPHFRRLMDSRTALAQTR